MCLVVRVVQHVYIAVGSIGGLYRGKRGGRWTNTRLEASDLVALPTRVTRRLLHVLANVVQRISSQLCSTQDWPWLCKFPLPSELEPVTMRPSRFV